VGDMWCGVLMRVWDESGWGGGWWNGGMVEWWDDGMMG
jgi:hypothetical protein